MLNQWQNQKNQRQKKLVNSQNQLLNQLLNQPEKLLLSLNPPLLNQLLHQQHNQLIGPIIYLGIGRKIVRPPLEYCWVGPGLFYGSGGYAGGPPLK